MLSQILASETYCSSRGMIPPRHTLSLLSLTEAPRKYSRRSTKYFRATTRREYIAAQLRRSLPALAQRQSVLKAVLLPSSDEHYGSNSQLVLTGQCMFPELQCLETRFGYLSLVGQSPSYGSASKALPRGITLNSRSR